MNTLKYFIPAAAVLILLAFGVTAYANPAFFQRKQSAAATSTLAYMTPGTATTSLIVDTQMTAFDEAGVFLQYSPSSTASILRWRYEFAQDGQECDDTPTACDWYSETVQNNASTASSTIEVMDFKEYSWQLSTSTYSQGGVAGGSDRGLKYISVPTPTRFTRVLFYLAPGTQNGAIWAEVIGQKQSTN